MLLVLALVTATAMPTEVDDARCLASISYIIGTSEEPKRKDLILFAMFFAGKLYGRNPDIDLTAVMKTTVKKLSATLAFAEIPRCAAEFEKAGQALSETGDVLAPSKPR